MGYCLTLFFPITLIPSAFFLLHLLLLLHSTDPSIHPTKLQQIKSPFPKNPHHSHSSKSTPSPSLSQPAFSQENNKKKKMPPNPTLDNLITRTYRLLLLSISISLLSSLLQPDTDNSSLHSPPPSNPISGHGFVLTVAVGLWAVHCAVWAVWEVWGVLGGGEGR